MGWLKEGICTKIDESKVVSGTCPTLVFDKVWEWLIYSLIKNTNINTISLYLDLKNVNKDGGE